MVVFVWNLAASRRLGFDMVHGECGILWLDVECWMSVGVLVGRASCLLLVS